MRAVEETGAGFRPLAVDGDLDALIRGGADPRPGVRDGATLEGRLVAPLRPGKIVAIGLNYADHIRETVQPRPTRPLVFAKFPSSVIGPDEAIVLDPELSERVDWEVELGVVVGRRMRRVPEVDALEHVLGYTVANDISARDVQFADGQWVRGKSFDTRREKLGCPDRIRGVGASMCPPGRLLPIMGVFTGRAPQHVPSRERQDSCSKGARSRSPWLGVPRTVLLLGLTSLLTDVSAEMVSMSCRSTCSSRSAPRLSSA